MYFKPLPPRIPFYRAAIPPVAALSTLLLTAIAVYYLHVTAKTNDDLRFDTAVQQTHNTLQERFQTYISLLYAGRGLFAAQPLVSQAHFHAFSEQLNLRQQYPGIQGIGFSQRVIPAEKEALVAQIQLQRKISFQIRPDFSRPEYHTIIYLEPLDQRNQAAIGYDMFTEPTRRSAMERARDTGIPALSGRVTLKQEIDQHKQAGFLVYMPIYEGAVIPPTVAERRKTLKGFVYSPFRADDFIQGIFGDRRNALVDFQVYDGTEINPQSILHRSSLSPKTIRGSRPKLTTTQQLQIAGHSWTLVFTSHPTLEQISEQRFIPFIVFLGGLISLILFGLTRSQAQARFVAEQAAKTLHKSEKALRKANANAQLAREQAEVANRLKDDFLAILSHELRSPLTPILGWSKLLQIGKFDQEKASKALATIEQNAKLQAQLIEDLLDISRILQGKLTLETSPVDLATIITTALATMQLSAEAKSIQITSILPSDIVVSGDANRLQQVVWNLLSNAIKFTPDGGRVDICLEKHESTQIRSSQPDSLSTGYAQITITDTGKGFSPEFRPYLFDSFRQEDSKITRRYGGLGLGLAIVQHLVELQGGSIQAESAGEGKGATFQIQLPLIQAIQNRCSQLPSTVGSMKNLQGLSILVVDDEVDMQELLTEILEAQGAEVKTTGSGKEVFTLLQQYQPNVLISDIAMPEMDGYRLIQEIRALPPEHGGTIPAIALTAYAGEMNQQRALASGFQIHLPKPLETEELLKAIMDLVGLPPLGSSSNG
jgi:signal transduction histidine kinase/ActR/RegA family two-component response regulator